jgi:hypothetical protein
MVWFAGMRGIVSYACANIFNDTKGHREEVLAITTAVALITLFLQGGLTTTAVKFLGIPIGVVSDLFMSRKSTSPLLSPRRIRVKSLQDFEKKFVYPLGMYLLLYLLLVVY